MRKQKARLHGYNSDAKVQKLRESFERNLKIVEKI